MASESYLKRVESALAKGFSSPYAERVANALAKFPNATLKQARGHANAKHGDQSLTELKRVAQAATAKSKASYARRNALAKAQGFASAHAKRLARAAVNHPNSSIAQRAGRAKADEIPLSFVAQHGGALRQANVLGDGYGYLFEFTRDSNNPDITKAYFRMLGKLNKLPKTGRTPTERLEAKHIVSEFMDFVRGLDEYESEFQSDNEDSG